MIAGSKRSLPSYQTIAVKGSPTIGRITPANSRRVPSVTPTAVCRNEVALGEPIARGSLPLNSDFPRQGQGRFLCHTLLRIIVYSSSGPPRKPSAASRNGQEVENERWFWSRDSFVGARSAGEGAARVGRANILSRFGGVERERPVRKTPAPLGHRTSESTSSGSWRGDVRRTRHFAYRGNLCLANRIDIGRAAQSRLVHSTNAASGVSAPSSAIDSQSDSLWKARYSISPNAAGDGDNGAALSPSERTRIGRLDSTTATWPIQPFGRACGAAASDPGRLRSHRQKHRQEIAHSSSVQPIRVSLR